MRNDFKAFNVTHPVQFLLETNICHRGEVEIQNSNYLKGRLISFQLLVCFSKVCHHPNSCLDNIWPFYLTCAPHISACGDVSPPQPFLFRWPHSMMMKSFQQASDCFWVKTHWCLEFFWIVFNRKRSSPRAWSRHRHVSVTVVTVLLFDNLIDSCVIVAPKFYFGFFKLKGVLTQDLKEFSNKINLLSSDIWRTQPTLVRC